MLEKPSLYQPQPKSLFSRDICSNELHSLPSEIIIPGLVKDMNRLRVDAPMNAGSATIPNLAYR
jgi:hypothetical protein